MLTSNFEGNIKQSDFCKKHYTSNPDSLLCIVVESLRVLDANNQQDQNNMNDTHNPISFDTISSKAQMGLHLDDRVTKKNISFLVYMDYVKAIESRYKITDKGHKCFEELRYKLDA